MKQIFFVLIFLSSFQASAQVFDHYYKDFVGNYEITDCSASKADLFCGMKKLTFAIVPDPEIGMEYVLFDTTGNTQDPSLIQSLIIAAYGFPGVDCGLTYGSSNCSGPGADVFTKFTKVSEEDYVLEGAVKSTISADRTYSYRLGLKRTR